MDIFLGGCVCGGGVFVCVCVGGGGGFVCVCVCEYWVILVFP